MSARPDGEIRIEYGVIAFRGGFLPLVRENGRVVSARWCAHGFGREEALEMAAQEATRASSRFVGDWNIEIKAIEGGAS